MSYIDTLTTEQKNNVAIITKRMISKGITNPLTHAGILSVTSKESGFIPKSELSYRNTSNERIRSIFSKLQPLSENDLTALKNDEVKFFDAIYGGRYGNASNEGYKYRGRGFNQITFKDNYAIIGKKIGIDLVNYPDRLNEPSVAADALIQFFIDGFDSLLRQQKLIAYNTPNINGFKTAQDSVAAAYHVNTGTGKTVQQAMADSTGGRQAALERVNDFVGFISKVVTETLSTIKTTAGEAATAVKTNPVKSVAVAFFFVALGLAWYKKEEIKTILNKWF